MLYSYSPTTRIPFMDNTPVRIVLCVVIPRVLLYYNKGEINQSLLKVKAIISRHLFTFHIHNNQASPSRNSLLNDGM